MASGYRISTALDHALWKVVGCQIHYSGHDKVYPSRVIMSLEFHVYYNYISYQVKDSGYSQTRKSTELPWKPR